MCEIKQAGGLPGTQGAVDAARRGARVAGVTVGLGVVASFLALAFAGQASATCHIAAKQQTPPAESLRSPVFKPAVYRPAEFLSTAFTAAPDEMAADASIVGLWEFEVRAAIDEGPFHKGDLLDWGLATWHDDGTEIQFSAGRPYDAGDVCMGVWKPTGHDKFHLNHVALGKDLATGATFDGLTNIRADVTVDRTDNHFTGSYLIIQYAGNPLDGTEFDQSTELYRFIATVTANRVSPN